MRGARLGMVQRWREETQGAICRSPPPAFWPAYLRSNFGNKIAETLLQRINIWGWCA